MGIAPWRTIDYIYVKEWEVQCAYLLANLKETVAVVSMSDKPFKHELTWEEKAKANPMFAVMSAELFKDSTGDPASWTQDDLDTFFIKGERLYRTYLAPILGKAGAIPQETLIIEYGSGMGRLLKAIQDDGYNVGGIDISPTMIDHCRRLVPHAKRLSVLGPDGRSTFPAECADFVFSYAVLQHISTLSGVERAIEEMCRIVRQDGLIIMQIRSPETPFVGMTGGARRVVNGERSSVLLSIGHRQLMILGRQRRIPGGRIRRVPHTNWSGVPIGYRKLTRTLTRYGASIVGIEHPSADGQEGVAWVLARKEEVR